MWPFRKAKYLLRSMEYIDEDSGEGEVVLELAKFATASEVKKDLIRSGEIVEGLYYLEDVKRGPDGKPKILWRMRQKKKQASPEDVNKMEKDKAMKALNDRAESLKQSVAEFQELKKAFIDKFGLQDQDANTGEDAVSMEDLKEITTIKEAVTKGWSRALYKDLMLDPGKASKSFYDLLNSVTVFANVVGEALGSKIADNTAKTPGNGGGSNKEKEKGQEKIDLRKHKEQQQQQEKQEEEEEEDEEEEESKQEQKETELQSSAKIKDEAISGNIKQKSFSLEKEAEEQEEEAKKEEEDANQG